MILVCVCVCVCLCVCGRGWTLGDVMVCELCRGLVTKSEVRNTHRRALGSTERVTHKQAAFGAALLLKRLTNRIDIAERASQMLHEWRQRLRILAAINQDALLVCALEECFLINREEVGEIGGGCCRACQEHKHRKHPQQQWPLHLDCRGWGWKVNVTPTHNLGPRSKVWAAIEKRKQKTKHM